MSDSDVAWIVNQIGCIILIPLSIILYMLSNILFALDAGGLVGGVGRIIAPLLFLYAIFNLVLLGTKP